MLRPIAFIDTMEMVCLDRQQLGAVRASAMRHLDTARGGGHGYVHRSLTALSCCASLEGMTKLLLPEFECGRA